MTLLPYRPHSGMCRCCCSTPSNTRRWPNAGLTLAHCLRRWPNISLTLCQHLVLAGTVHDDVISPRQPVVFLSVLSNEKPGVSRKFVEIGASFPVCQITRTKDNLALCFTLTFLTQQAQDVESMLV